MQPDPDDLVGPSRFHPAPMAHPEAYSARVCSGQEPQSLGWPISVVIVKVPACISPRPVCSWAIGCCMMLCCPAKQETPMLMSTDRILVSHVGSLPRPPTLSE